MQTSKPRTGSSRTQGRINKAEEFTCHARLSDTPSASKPRPEEARQGEEGPLLSVEVPLLQQNADHTPVSVVDETHSAVPPEPPTTTFTSPLAPSVTGGDIADPGNHGLISGRLPVPDRTAISESQEQLAPIGDSESKSSSKGSGLNGSRLAVGGEALYDFYKLGQSDMNAPSVGGPDKNNLHTDSQWSQYNYSQVPLSEPAVVEGQIAETCIESERDLDDGSMDRRTGDQNDFDMKPNNGFDMDAEFSTPMVEDQFEYELQFGTTFHPHHYDCQPSPYGEGVNKQRDDIVLEDSILECAEDSAMEDAEPETQDVAGMATATRVVQPQSTPLVVPSNEYVSPSGVLPWPRVETPAFVETMPPIFEPPMLGEPHAPNSVALQGLVFSQAALLPDNAPVFVSDRVQSSTSVAEINSLEYQEPVGFLESAITALGASASQAASCSSHSPLFPSPPRAVSTPVATTTPPPIYTHIRDHQREIEGVDSTFDSAQGVNIDVGIQRDLKYV